MRSTDIVAYHRNGFYGIPIIVRNTTFAIKLDSGASNTVISIEKITGNLTDVQREVIRCFIKEKGITPREFKSASGHSFCAYPAYMSNASIGNTLFKEFYYYLVIDRLYQGRQIALLGDDFINCCRLSKEPCGDIYISHFDHSSYNLTDEAISTEEIYSLTI